MGRTPQKLNPTAKKRKPPWIPAFLEGLASTGNVRYSCLRAKVDRKAAYALRNSDAEFAEQWDDALDEAADALELECRRRAAQGIDREKWHRTGTDAKGRAVFKQVIEKQYSDVLLMFLLKSIRPEKYRDAYDFAKTVATLASASEPTSGGKSGASEAPGGE